MWCSPSNNNFIFLLLVSKENVTTLLITAIKCGLLAKNLHSLHYHLFFSKIWSPQKIHFFCYQIPSQGLRRLSLLRTNRTFWLSTTSTSQHGSRRAAPSIVAQPQSIAAPSLEAWPSAITWPHPRGWPASGPGSRRWGHLPPPGEVGHRADPGGPRQDQ